MPAAVRLHPDACPGVFALHDAADGALARIRLPGGVMTAAALRAVADCARRARRRAPAPDLAGEPAAARAVAVFRVAGPPDRTPGCCRRRRTSGCATSLASPLAGIASDPVAGGRVADDRAPAETVCDVRSSGGLDRCAVRAAGAGRAAGAVPVRAGRRARRRRGGGAGPVLARARRGCWSPAWTRACACRRPTRWRYCSTRRRRSWPCAPWTAGRRGGRRSWRTPRRGSRRVSPPWSPRDHGIRDCSKATLLLARRRCRDRSPATTAASPSSSRRCSVS